MSFSRPKARRPRRAVVKIVCLVLHGQSSNDQAPQKFKYFSPQFLGIRHTVLGAQVSSNAPQFGSASSLAKSQRRVARVTGRTTRSSTSGRRNHISREHQIAPSSDRERKRQRFTVPFDFRDAVTRRESPTKSTRKRSSARTNFSKASKNGMKRCPFFGSS